MTISIGSPSRDPARRRQLAGSRHRSLCPGDAGFGGNEFGEEWEL